MSNNNHLFDWCRMPPEPPKNRHKRLLAGSLIITVLSISILSTLTAFNVGMMAGQTGALAAPKVVLSIADVAEGPKYIQNVTYQCTNDTYQQSLQKSPTSPLKFGCTGGHSIGETGCATANLINDGEKDLTVTAIEIYQGNTLFASVTGPFTVKAHSKGEIDFQVYNLNELAKSEVLWRTGKQIPNGDTSREWVQYWLPVLYNAVIRTSEGVTYTDYNFVFPTAPGSI
ncbi:MAG: hypothetical protein ACQCN3_13365 [Candidatus Bathyarchaeia archaeon]|jgi:hypothetical protein